MDYKFTPSNMLQQYLEAEPRNMYNIVGALMGYINADPAFKTNDFDNAVQYVLKYGISKDELFAEFDESMKLEENHLKWTKEYYSYARVYLKENFCEKRINHVKEVAKTVYPDVARVKTSHNNNPKKVGSQQDTAEKNVMPIGAILAIIIGIIVLLALIIKMVV